MNTTHTQPAGIPASFSQKLAILTSLVCKTKFAMVYEMDEINDVDGWTIWDDKSTICYWASIDDALIAVQKWHQFNNTVSTK